LVKPRVGDLLHAFKSSVDEFHGDVQKDKQSCASWIEKIMTWRCGLLKEVSKPLIVVAVAEALRGEAKEVVKGQAYETLGAMFVDLHSVFLLVIYQQELLGMFKSGEAFKNVTRRSFARILKQYIDDCQGVPIGIAMLAEAIQKMLPMEWKIIHKQTTTITLEELTEAVVTLEEMFLVDPDMQVKPFGKMVKPKASLTETHPPKTTTSVNTANLVKAEPASIDVQPKKTTKQGRTAQKNAKARADKTEVEELRALVDRLVNSGKRTTDKKPNAANSGEQTRDKKPKTDGRQIKSHWVYLDAIEIGNKIIKTVADPGAAVSLIRSETAQQLKLNVLTERKPLLRSPRSKEPYKSLGTTNARVSIESGPKKWMQLVVVDSDQPWDLLLGSAHLCSLKVQLMTPAMVKQLKRKEKEVPKAGDTVAVECVEDTTDRTSRTEQPVAELTMPTEQDHVDLSESAMITEHDSLEGTAPELRTDQDLQEQQEVTTIWPRKLRAKLGLPVDYYMNCQGNDFFELDNLYLRTTKASVKVRIRHQLTDPADEEQLLSKLMDMGASTLHEYPLGCPPPAALWPIKPPMKDGATLMYTVQHQVSEAGQAAREEFVAPRVKYGIDAPTSAVSQMPVFTLPKPNTTAQRVLFDDTTNNVMNMLYLRVQLATPYD
ncbi:hypothetical protein H4S08_004785, partial [Coemansia sp. RSA 1365]